MRPALGALLLLLVAVPAHARERMPIPQCAATDARFATLVAALKQSGLAVPLSGSGPFTLFAPTEAAFAALPEGQLAALMQPDGKTALMTLLAAHVLPGRITADDVPAPVPPSMAGTPLDLTAPDGRLLVGGETADEPITCGNGIVYPVGRLLAPRP